MLKSGSKERHPFSSLLLLLLLVFAGAFVFTLIGLAVGGWFYGLQSLTDLKADKQGSFELLRLLQIFSSFGMFVVPALIFAIIEAKDWISYLQLRRFYIILALLTIVIMLSLGPILELSSEMNKSMKLPGFLKELEAWMLLKEQQMSELTKQLLRMDSIGVLMVNLLMLAMIPAFGEELIFRGCLQKIFSRWTGNHHVAIWLTAIIFSAIHFQFYGFIPRMLLGAFFGYILIWSGSLWLPILAHFMNNAVAVITAYVYQLKGISLDKLDHPDPSSGYVYVFSFALCIPLMWIFYMQSLKQGYISERTDGSGLD